MKAVWGGARSVLALALVLVWGATASAQVRVTAAWDPNNDGLTVGYRVFVGVTPGAYVAEFNVGLQTSAPLDLPVGQTYYVAVRAYNSAGQLGPSSGEIAIDLTAPPGPPTDVRASVNGARALLEWDAPTGGGLPMQYFVTVGSAPGSADILNGFPLGFTHSASGDLPQGRYYARLYAGNLLGVSAPSPEVSFQVNSPTGPLNPVGLSHSWQGTVAVLTWSPPPGASGAQVPTSYVIEAGRSSGASDVGTFNVGGVTSFATDVAPGTYYVRVRGVNAYGVSGPSNEIVVQGQGGPGQPTGLVATGSGSTVNLRWNAPTSGSAPTGYILEAGSAPGLSNLATLTIGNQTTFSTTAPPGTYYVRVRAINARGAGNPSNEIVVRR